MADKKPKEKQPRRRPQWPTTFPATGGDYVRQANGQAKEVSTPAAKADPKPAPEGQDNG